MELWGPKGQSSPLHLGLAGRVEKQMCFLAQHGA